MDSESENSVLGDNFLHGQAVVVNWIDNSCNAGTSDDGSYTGTAKFVRHLRKGMVGDEMLENGPHVIVKVSGDDRGSFFPLSSISSLYDHLGK